MTLKTILDPENLVATQRQPFLPGTGKGGSVSRFFGFGLSREGLQISMDRHANGWIVAFLAVAFYVAVFLSTLKVPYYGPFSTVDEQILYYQSALNFNRFGFLATAFLQDFSTSSNPTEHPYVYNHMPAGPEIFTAVLMRIFGEDYRLLRVVFAAIFVAGLYCFYRWASVLLRSLGFIGAGLAFMFLRPWTLLHAIDHPMYCAFPLLVFFPLVALEKYYETRRSRWLVSALATVFLSSIYLAYQFVIMTGMCWIFLRLLRISRFERRHVMAFFGMTLLGILLHLVQNIVYFGPATAIRDVGLTLSNRLFGVPTGEALVDYYHGMGIVHHGMHRFDLFLLVKSILRSLHFPGAVALGLLGMFILGRELRLIARFEKRSGTFFIPFKEFSSIKNQGSAFDLMRLALLIGVTIVVPLIAFPAYSADYNLQGLGQFFSSLVAVAVLGWGWSHLRMAQGYREPFSDRRFFSFPLVSWGILLAVCVGGAFYAQIGYFKEMVSELRASRYADLPKLSELVKDKVTMTNIYPAVVGFFSREATIGGAEFTVFPEKEPPNPNAAYARHVRGMGLSRTVKPTHYVLFKALFTGFTRYRDLPTVKRLRNWVARKHKIVYEDDLFTVFELVY